MSAPALFSNGLIRRSLGEQRGALALLNTRFVARASEATLQYLFLLLSHSCVNLHNQQHVLVMCAVAFYMMENYPLDVGTEFMAGIIQVGILFRRGGGTSSSKRKALTRGFVLVTPSSAVSLHRLALWCDGVGQ